VSAAAVESMPAGDVVNLSSLSFFTGSYVFSEAAAAPAGWYLLKTGGAIEKISDYPNLAALIGNRYGGDGVTTFGTPPAEYVLAGPSAAHALWNLYGEETHTLADAEIPPVTVGEGTNNDGSTSSAFLDGRIVLTDHAATSTVAINGGGGAHNNLQPTHRVNVFIKT